MTNTTSGLVECSLVWNHKKPKLPRMTKSSRRSEIFGWHIDGEAAALAGANVLRAAADHVIESRIEPMANEVRRRWKHLCTASGSWTVV